MVAQAGDGGRGGGTGDSNRKYWEEHTEFAEGYKVREIEKERIQG